MREPIFIFRGHPNDPPVTTPEKILEEFKAIPSERKELAHLQADRLLCRYLEAIGYPQAAQAWREVCIRTQGFGYYPPSQE